MQRRALVAEHVLEGAELEAVLPQSVLDRCSVLRGRPRRVCELAGGLTNKNFRITTDQGDYVLRLSSKESRELSVDRVNEHRNTLLASQSGVGAPVYDFLPDDCVLVIGYIDGVTLTDASFRAEGTLPRVAAAVRRLHNGPRFVVDFDMFKIQADYQARVLSKGYRLPADYLDHEPAIRTIETALRAVHVATVPCNNDLLAGNFIDTGSEIRLIDYEYSGNNDPYFELGNIWSECHLADEQLEELVVAYVGRSAPHLVARARLQALMSQYGWTLWASIQDATSAIDFDFWEWGMEKYERAVALLRSPALYRLLEAVQQAD